MPRSVNSELLQAPLPDMVERLGTAIANAQYAMDYNSIRIAQLMADREERGVQIGNDPVKRSLLELGFTPSFYHVSEATIEARVTFSASTSSSFSLGVQVSGGATSGFAFFAASVNASYTNKYSFDAAGSSLIKARFVSVPPPAALANILGAQRQPQEEEGET